MFIGLDKAHFLSPSGQCKSFDAAADGYCRAEACAAVVLKPLKDALVENDQVLGIIRSSELRQSGNASSITHPHSPTQQKLLRRLLQRSATDPNDVSVVEAHGTGTRAGDPSELNSIFKVLCPDRTTGTPLYVTSHKANMGHSEAVSGLIATIKLCLMFKYGRIPPQASLITLNPQIEGLDENCTIIPREAVEWKRTEDRKRLGVVNNFGAAGSIGAILMEEPPKDRARYDASATEEYTNVLCLSAKTEAALQLLQTNALSHLETIDDSAGLQDFCYTLTARRMTFDKQIIATGRSVGGILENLRKARCFSAAKTEAKVVFVFSGQGSQVPMASQPYHAVFVLT